MMQERQIGGTSIDDAGGTLEGVHALTIAIDPHSLDVLIVKFHNKRGACLSGWLH